MRGIITDIAQTINIHPSNLCIDAEDGGKLYIGDDVVVKVYISDNLFKLEEVIRPTRISSNARASPETIKQQCGKPKRLVTGSQLPSHIIEVELGQNSTLLTVVVVEHPNLGSALTWLDARTGTCLIVMVRTDSFPYVIYAR